MINKVVFKNCVQNNYYVKKILDQVRLTFLHNSVIMKVIKISQFHYFIKYALFLLYLHNSTGDTNSVPNSLAVAVPVPFDSGDQICTNLQFPASSSIPCTAAQCSNISQEIEKNTFPHKPSADLNVEVSGCSTEPVIVQPDCSSVISEACMCCSGEEPNKPSKSDYNYNNTAKRYGSQLRKLDPNWLHKWQWLTFCQQRQAVLCWLCMWMTRGRRWTPDLKVEAAFTTHGFSSWHVATKKFTVHENSDMHRAADISWSHRANPSAATQLDKQHAANQRERSASLLDQLESLLYLSRQGLAIRGHVEVEGNLPQLLTLRSKDSPRLSKWLSKGKYMSHDVINEQLHLLSMEMLRPLLVDIRSAQCFSVIADETRDMSGHEQFSISIRWINSGSEVREDCIGLVEVQNTDSATLSGVIKDSLIRCNLDLQKLVGQGYDGASNMSGRLTGVGARISAEYPAAMYIHCNNHCLQLCVQDAGSESRCVQEGLNLCTTIYNLIKLSPKRLGVFETIQKHQPAHNQSNASIKPLCSTRWTVRAAAISSIIDNYDALQETLDQIINENKRDDIAAKAGGILAQMETFHTLFGLHYAKLIFSATDQSAVTLQGKDITATDARGIINSLKAYLDSLRDSFEIFWTSVVQFADKKNVVISIPRQRNLPKKLDDTQTQHKFAVNRPEEYYRQQYNAVIEAIKGQLETRFSQAALDRLSVIETTLLDGANGRQQALYSTDAYTSLLVYEHLIDIQKLDTQLHMLPSVIETVNQMNKDNKSYSSVNHVSSVRSLVNILSSSQFGQNLCSEVYRLCLIYLTVPMTSATAERSFSTMRRIKTYLHYT